MISLLVDLLRRPRTRTLGASPEPPPLLHRGVALPRPTADADGLVRGAEACPTRAVDPAGRSVDLGRCVMCGRCAEAAPSAYRLAPDSRHASSSRRALVVGADGLGADAKTTPARLAALAAGIRRALSRSIHVIEVSAGSCNGCDWEIASLTGPDYDLQHYGMDIVASPRHADVLAVTGCPSRQMAAALREAYEAAPDPRLVIAIGACAISGGAFAGSYAVLDGVDRAVPVDVYVPGCPPRPEVIVEGLLLAAGRLVETR